MTNRVETFADTLAIGGKTNSLGKTNQVIEAVLNNKDLLDELYTCVFNADPWIRMRAIDAVEKISRQNPNWLTPYIDRFQSDLSSSTQPSIQWHLVQMYGQLSLTTEQKRKAVTWLTEVLSNKEVDWIVAVNAMKTLVQFTKGGTVKANIAEPLIKLHLKHKSKTVVKKANQFLLEISQ